MGKGQDSREKLESDCRKLIVKIQKRTFSGRDATALRCQLYELLDRQAAITEHEREQHWLEIIGASANCNLELTNKIAELQEKIAALTAENNEYESICDRGKTLFDDVRAERDDYRRRLSDIREIATFPLCIDYDHEEVDA